jgi:hypothetical protein
MIDVADLGQQRDKFRVAASNWNRSSTIASISPPERCLRFDRRAFDFPGKPPFDACHSQ